MRYSVYEKKVDKEFFDNYKLAAERLIIKERYIFHSEKSIVSVIVDHKTETIELPVIKYEVDRYKKKDGSFSEWCKIDIELDEAVAFVKEKFPSVNQVILKVKITHLPFQPIDATPDFKDEKKDFIKKLWEEELVYEVLNANI
jgi:hypothetical protein